MRIAQVAPLFESVPPRKYGGTERVISVLTQELSYLGHEVTVFATADSVVHGELVPCRQTPLVAGAGDSSEAADHILEFDRVRRRLDDFDVIHFHTRFSHFPMFEDIAQRTVTTCHNRVDFPELTRFYTRFRHFPLIALSRAQRNSRPHANWADVIHHGYPLDYLPAYDRPNARDGYLAFLGRICAEKGVLDAIRIARMTGKQLKIAARINNLDREFWDRHVRKLVDGEQIQFVGEISDAEKPEFLNCASALLFPIQWPEPFGLVMIEAMACGTPVIGYATGSVPEVIDNGQSGFVVADVDSAAEAVRRLGEIDRATVRACFEARFSSRRMAERHVALYEKLGAAGTKRSARAMVQHRGALDAITNSQSRLPARDERPLAKPI
ncbi:glycosyltransferase family 4 protein [Marivita sp. GX14005]|uniref:glycosyltransferase family 4 protein n=1 Tax=Marivita sp. GX14005 TaxID=2942276 RepID=UPI0020187EC2|nr:glycosyltransferase family 4 protein [Marivita sp. GX14005]MCL3882689.1 glycosyltransferase family 4 protein [Marivita sp. GX14005]